MWVTILFAGIAALFTFMTASMLFHLRWVQRLPHVPPVGHGPNGSADTG
jgi:hypothetical protein